MPRKPRELTNEQRTILEQMARTGGTEQGAAKATGLPPRTAGRLLKQLRGPVSPRAVAAPKSRQGATAPPAPRRLVPVASPDRPAAAPAEAASLDDVRSSLGQVLETLRSNLDQLSHGPECSACGRGMPNIDGVAKIGRVLAQVGAIVARTQPVTPPDPDDDPDMLAAAEKAKERFRRRVAELVKEVSR